MIKKIVIVALKLLKILKICWGVSEREVDVTHLRTGRMIEETITTLLNRLQYNYIIKLIYIKSFLLEKITEIN